VGLGGLDSHGPQEKFGSRRRGGSGTDSRWRANVRRSEWHALIVPAPGLLKAQWACEVHNEFLTPQQMQERTARISAESWLPTALRRRDLVRHPRHQHRITKVPTAVGDSAEVFHVHALQLNSGCDAAALRQCLIGHKRP
jgi:hypothetical protein